LIKYQTRMQRNISAESTILFMAYNNSEETVMLYKNLINQVYRNYELIVIDLSPQQQAANMLKLIPDPRVMFIDANIDFPEYEEQEIIKRVTKNISTPFMIVCGRGPALEPMGMEFFCLALRKAQVNVLSVSYNLTRDDYVYDNETYGLTEINNLTLYKTKKLVKAISCKETYSKDYLTVLMEKVNGSYSLLDIGCGICSYLDTFLCNFIIALDIHRPYLEKRQSRLPHIFPVNADALQISQLFLPKTVSTVLLNDTLEHFSKKNGLALIQKVEVIATNRVIVFTPRGFFKQERYDYYNLNGEQYQEHRSGWEVEEFLELGFQVIIFKDMHDASNASFVHNYGTDHPPIDAIFAWKDL
jgi:hypothetical protein